VQFFFHTVTIDQETDTSGLSAPVAILKITVVGQFENVAASLPRQIAA
jgi:hypothetical protein